MTPRVVVQREDFDPGAEIAALEDKETGAVASFCGNVRGREGLVALDLEHFPGMTAAAIAGIADEMTERWALTGATVIHRYGRLALGDHIVFVGAAAAHREAAIEAMHFVIDRLKTDAPFWKCEEFVDGRREWVAPRLGDDAARRRWNQ